VAIPAYQLKGERGGTRVSSLSEGVRGKGGMKGPSPFLSRLGVRQKRRKKMKGEYLSTIYRGGRREGGRNRCELHLNSFSLRLVEGKGKA